jgi:hypothetical protein
MDWRVFLAAAGMAGCLATTGCAVTRRSASYDSMSRMPWFNLELATPQRKPAPETQRIRRDGSVPLEPEPAKLVTPAKPADSNWWQRLTGAEKEKPKPISIPRTDVAVGPPLPSLTEEPADEEFDAVEF